MCFFSEDFKTIRPFSLFPRCQYVYTRQAGRTPALQQNWQSSEKSQHFEEKTQYLINTLYLPDLLSSTDEHEELYLINFNSPLIWQKSFRTDNKFCIFKRRSSITIKSLRKEDYKGLQYTLILSPNHNYLTFYILYI